MCDVILPDCAIFTVQNFNFSIAAQWGENNSWQLVSMSIIGLCFFLKSSTRDSSDFKPLFNLSNNKMRLQLIVQKTHGKWICLWVLFYWNYLHFFFFLLLAGKCLKYHQVSGHTPTALSLPHWYSLKTILVSQTLTVLNRLILPRLQVSGQGECVVPAKLSL